MIISCNQNPTKSNPESKIKIVKIEPQESISNYIEHPKLNDKICTTEIERAKKDIQKGELVFSMPNGEGDYDLRQEKYIRKLCEKYNLVFRFEMISDAIVEEGRQGCYGAYMDKKLAEKYGSKFKQSILDQADLMLIKSNDTVVSWDCDKEPKIEGITSENMIEVQLDENLKNELSKNKINYNAGIDIGFYIDKKGIPSGYYLVDYNRTEKGKTQKYKQQLLQAGIDELKKHQRCVSGEIKGQKVITKQIIRTYFN